MSAHVLLVEGDAALARRVAMRLRNDAIEVTPATTRAEAMERLSQRTPHLVVVADRLPDGSGLELVRAVDRVSNGEAPAVMVLGESGGVEEVVEAMRVGCIDFFTRDTALDELALRVRAALKLASLRGSRRDRSADRDAVYGESAATQALREQIQVAADADETTVLVVGESGSGKLVAARAVHGLSGRRDGPLVEVDATTLSPDLGERELFGHERGAFPGADEHRVGLVEVATAGTLVVEDVAALSPAIQAHVVRLLQEGVVRRVGGTSDRRVDVRVVATTNRDLAEEVEAGRFRSDLYYRLRVLEIAVPPLRDRREDIVPLAESFVLEFAQKLRKPSPVLTRRAKELLRTMSFPGNVRELRALIEQAVARARGAEIDDDLLGRSAGSIPPPSSLSGASVALPQRGAKRGRPFTQVTEDEERRIRDAMVSAFGNQSKAAEALGISRFALRRKLLRIHKLA